MDDFQDGTMNYNDIEEYKTALEESEGDVEMMYTWPPSATSRASNPITGSGDPIFIIPNSVQLEILPAVTILSYQ
jgi:hypothetical protein